MGITLLLNVCIYDQQHRLCLLNKSNDLEFEKLFYIKFKNSKKVVIITYFDYLKWMK